MNTRPPEFANLTRSRCARAVRAMSGQRSTLQTSPAERSAVDDPTRRRLRGGATPRQQVPDAGERCVDGGRRPFEVTAQGVQEVRERSCVEVLRAIRVVACLLPRRVERRLQLA